MEDVVLMRTVLAIAVGLSGASGCMKTSEKYCQLHAAEDPDNCPPVDAPIGGACLGDPDCAVTPATPACDTGKHVCVVCVTNAHCTNPMPVCAADQTCHGCTAHTDCASLVCEETGQCAAEADVAYVAPTGSGSMCTKAEPCADVDSAEKKKRRIIKVDGTTVFDNLTVLQPTSRLDVYAAPGAKMQRTQNGAVLEIRGSSEVHIHGLEISNATGTNSAHGIVVTQDSPKLTLDHVLLVNNAGLGLFQSTGTLAMDGCVVVKNSSGGANVQGTGFSITNSIFVLNGTLGVSLTGGALLGASGGADKFDFNTVAENASNTSVVSRGVSCATAGVTLTNSVFQNARTGSMCTVDTSLFDASPAAGNNLTGDAMFDVQDPTMYASTRFFRILTGSAAHNQASATATLARDIDRDARPQEGRRDMGADEYKP